MHASLPPAAPKKLGRTARRTFERSDIRAWVPAAVLAEIVLLKELGRTEIGLPQIRRAFDEGSWRFLPLDVDQLDAFPSTPSIRDPFDRLVVAAARTVRAKLVSK